MSMLKMKLRIVTSAFSTCGALYHCLMLLLRHHQRILTSEALSLSSSLTTISKSSTTSISSMFSSFARRNCNSYYELFTHNNDDSTRIRKDTIVMRKQKASDKRTRRRQRGLDGGDDVIPFGSGSSNFLNSLSTTTRTTTVTRSPMDDSKWNHKKVIFTRNNKNSFPSMNQQDARGSSGGRGRARKRSEVYSSLSLYHTTFLNLLTEEYKAEEAEVLGRLEASLDNPLSLEDQGHALFDMYPERRGNIFGDEVYRFSKAKDSVSNYFLEGKVGKEESTIKLPQHHKFTTNDIILLTVQPNGSGDFFDTTSAPNHKDSISIEGRILNTGPAYIDIAIRGGIFEGTFGSINSKASSNLRLRVDRFFSNVPYLRMVSALGKMTSLPPASKSANTKAGSKGKNGETNNNNNKASATAKLSSSSSSSSMMDPIIRQAIVSTFGLSAKDPSIRDRTSLMCDVNQLGKQLSKSPFGNMSLLWTRQVMEFIESSQGRTNVFKRTYNGPQLKVIEASLSRKLTMIHGPPGTGKTSVASAIAFGFVHQCRNINIDSQKYNSNQTHKVLACAFSNVGADNLAEAIINLGSLNVIRIGKASSVTNPNLLSHTLDAAIDRDPIAKRALEEASKATAILRSTSSTSASSSTTSFQRDMATTAVKAAQEACRVAATKALRDADVIVCTSIGAADTYLLSACGIMTEDEIEELKKTSSDDKSSTTTMKHKLAPDGLPVLNIPFVIVDEACQSVEPATLIPITSTDSCKSLVLLGDPCQLPPTVKTDVTGLGELPLSQSLMSRLAQTLAQPVLMYGQSDTTPKDLTYMNAKPTKQAVSFMNYKRKIMPLTEEGSTPTSSPSGAPASFASSSYRKQFSGSLLLSLQYRMHPSISAFSSAIFYDGLLDTPSMMSQLRLFPDGLSSLAGAAVTQELPSTTVGSVAVRFIDVGGKNNERRGTQKGGDILNSRIDSWTAKLFADDNIDAAAAAASGTTATTSSSSYYNEAEAIEIVHILKTLYEHSTAPTMPQSIGIVTPYSAQVGLIKTKIDEDNELSELIDKSSNCRIEIKSIDAFQGRECDVILFSAVRSNRYGNIGFLKDWRRMNVALTRAKHALIVVGCRETLRQSGGGSDSSNPHHHWEAFIKWCDGMKCVIPSSSSTTAASSS